MSFIDHAAKRIGLKLLYWGPPGSGKWTNLGYIYARTSPAGASVPKANNVGFPLSLGDIRGFKSVITVYRVPGDGAHTEYVMDDIDGRSTDGVVFVADSARAAADANRASLDQLVRQLAARGFDLGKLSVVMQWNKRDVPGALPVEQLRSALNPWGFAEQEAIATQGVGVFDALKAVSKLMLTELRSAG